MNFLRKKLRIGYPSAALFYLSMLSPATLLSGIMHLIFPVSPAIHLGGLLPPAQEIHKCHDKDFSRRLNLLIFRPEYIFTAAIIGAAAIYFCAFKNELGTGDFFRPGIINSAASHSISAWRIQAAATMQAITL